jgi:CRP-like cAMP-binding protein/rhodanese-related sulfurtransferase
MPVSAKNKEYSLLANLVPLNTLDEGGLQALLQNVDVEVLSKGDVLFNEGDVDHVNVYLLSGKVGLDSGGSQVDQVDESSATARFPIAHQLPRKFTAKALSRAEIVRIDSRTLSEALADNESKGQVVEDVAVEDEEEDWMSQLLQSRVMQNIPAANLQGVMMRMQESPVKEGDMIITEGDEGDFYYLLHRGQATILKWNETKQEQTELARLAPGASFGEDALLSESPRGSSVQMLTDGIVLKLAKEDFIELIQHPLSESVSYEEACAIINDGGKWLDVRLPEEFEKGHLSGAINMPHPTLRFQIPSLSDEHHYVIVSQSGQRSIACGFLFLERGFQVSTLDGGYDNVPHEEPEAEVDEVQETAAEAPSTEAATSTAVSSEADQKLIAELQLQVAEQEDAIVELQEQLEAARASAGSASGEADAGDVAALKKEIEGLEREVIGLTGQLESEEDGYDKLKQQYDALSSENKKHLQIRDADIAKLKEQLTVLQLEKDQIETEYEDLLESQEQGGDSDSAELEVKTQQALNQVSQLEALNASITQDRDEMRNDVENIRNQLSLANQENSELQLEISELKGRLAELGGDAG